MIFNPLFFNNNTDNHIISNRTEKLSKKKYLFSDIVKVVMNPILDPKDKSAQVVYNESKDLEIPMAYGQIPVKMHLKFVSNLNNELNEKELTEILPSEISKFITTTNDAEEEIISYLSKDQLNGELKSFVNNVIDPEFINNIISQGQGLLLSIEDSKSAVNIELSKASNNIENNITVQTVIIPQKEKLLSIVAEDKNSQSLFRYKNDRTVPISEVTKSENRPSMSLYVFKDDNHNKI